MFTLQWPDDPINMPAWAEKCSVSLDTLNAVSQWIALIPLVVHLATPKGDHTLVGELALAGRLTMSLFPKLGHLRGISRLLHEIPDFLDRASSKSDLSSTIWDVDWGSSFLCANGAARDCLTKFALRHSKHVRDTELNASEMNALAAPGQVPLQSIGQEPAGDSFLRRYQTLHVIEINRTSSSNSSRHSHFWKFVGEFAHIPLLFALFIGLVLVSTYGAAANVALCIVTQLACRYVPIGRPKGYLLNTERYEYACMLSAIHSNASTWYLYIGDRPSIDWLLNKTMVSIGKKNTAFWAYAFRVCHWFELLAMTYVAGRAQWDGVFLLVLVLLNLIFKSIWEYPSHWAALQWTFETKVDVRAHSFKLTGRVPMLGAIHLLSAKQRYEKDGPSEENIAWMDEILPPSPRRQTWVDKLARLATQTPTPPPEINASEVLPLSNDDLDWVDQNFQRARSAYRYIRQGLAVANNGPTGTAEGWL